LFENPASTSQWHWPSQIKVKVKRLSLSLSDTDLHKLRSTESQASLWQWPSQIKAKCQSQGHFEESQLGSDDVWYKVKEIRTTEKLGPLNWWVSYSLLLVHSEQTLGLLLWWPLNKELTSTVNTTRMFHRDTLHSSINSSNMTSGRI